MIQEIRHYIEEQLKDQEFTFTKEKPIKSTRLAVWFLEENTKDTVASFIETLNSFNNKVFRKRIPVIQKESNNLLFETSGMPFELMAFQNVDTKIYRYVLSTWLYIR